MSEFSSLTVEIARASLIPRRFDGFCASHAEVEFLQIKFSDEHFQDTNFAIHVRKSSTKVFSNREQSQKK